MKRTFLTLMAFCTSAYILPMQRVRHITTPYKPRVIVSRPISEKINAKKCNHLIMILDPLHQEKTENRDLLAMTNTFIVAVEGKKIPILTTKNIALNFVLKKNLTIAEFIVLTR